MNSVRNNRGTNAFTAKELLVVITVVVVLFLVVFVAPLARVSNHDIRVDCANRLKQLCLASAIWAGDNGNDFSMFVHTDTNGTRTFATNVAAFRYFQVMSNEIVNPKILVCPGDKQHTPATNFTSDFNNSNISYFLGLNGDERYPSMLLAGDSNITNGTKLKNGIVEITSTNSAGWTFERHHGAGNVALADGSIQQWNDSGLNEGLRHTGFATNYLLIP